MGYRIINPYSIYILSFALALAVYQLDWSVYFPPISTNLLIFFLVSFAVTTVIAFFHYRWTGTNYKPISISLRIAVIWTGVIYLSWIIEFIYAGGIPVFKMLARIPFDYRSFGVPSLHVLLVTFSSFFLTYLFHGFISSRKKVLLWLCIANLIPAILIMNRGMLMLNLSNCVFVYLLSQEASRFKVKSLLAGLALSAIVLFFFGVLGNLRTSNNLGRLYDRGLVFESGEAKEEMRRSWMPSEFFWTYFYLSAPLGNLQHNIDHADPGLTGRNFLTLINNELLPDALSKRINNFIGNPKRTRLQVADHLNASTFYGGAFYYFGWAGMILMFVVIMVIPLISRLRVLADSKYYITFLGGLNTMYLFLIFDNMLVFTGFSFQFVFPLALAIIEGRKHSSVA